MSPAWPAGRDSNAKSPALSSNIRAPSGRALARIPEPRTWSWALPAAANTALGHDLHASQCLKALAGGSSLVWSFTYVVLAYSNRPRPPTAHTCAPCAYQARMSQVSRVRTWAPAKAAALWSSSNMPADQLGLAAAAGRIDMKSHSGKNNRRQHGQVTLAPCPILDPPQ